MAQLRHQRLSCAARTIRKPDKAETFDMAVARAVESRSVTSTARSDSLWSAAGLRAAFGMVTALLVGLGVLMVYSASLSLEKASEQQYLVRHLIALAVGLTAALAAAALPAPTWRHVSTWAFLLTLVLLVLVLLPGFSNPVRGARRWLRWGAWSFQPAELAKVTMMLFLARLVSAQWWRSAHWSVKLIAPLVPVGVTAALVILQPDFGTTVFLVILGGVVLYLAGVRLWQLFLVGAAALPVLGFFVMQEPYRYERLVGFVRAWSDTDQAQYQVRQSLITLGSGGLLGKGVGKGWQKLSYLPEANTDFVFAVIGEELGLVGTLTVLLLELAMLLVGVQLLRTIKSDDFAFRAGAALLVGLVLQALVNIAVVTALLPPKGIPLPLVSYGGSSLVVSLLAVGILISLSRTSGELKN